MDVEHGVATQDFNVPVTKAEGVVGSYGHVGSRGGTRRRMYP